MNIDLNLDLRLTVEDGRLVVRIVQGGVYPHFEDIVIAEASISLTALQDQPK